MSESLIQFNGNDGCVYIFDLEKRNWKKLCPVESIPPDIRKQVYEYLEDVESKVINATALKNAV